MGRHLTSSLRAQIVVLVAAMTVVGAALAANQPGDPCSPNGTLADLNGGKIQCVNGVWQPYSTNGPSPGTTTPVTPATSSPSVASTTVKTSAIFKRVGVALTDATFGVSSKQVSDVTAIRLANGRVRLYAFVSPDGLRSATSTNATGTSFVADPGLRIGWAPGGQPRAYALADGRVRLFYLDGGAIKSAISKDGLTFTDEGVRISSADAGFEPGGISVVKVGSGYRAYFSNLEKPGVKADRITKTATSPDMLTWTVGPTITGASGTITAGASHPFAVTDGKTIALYYNGDRGSYYGTLRATSTDGIHFANERAIFQMAGDPQLVALAGKTVLLYYGFEVAGHGFGIDVARTTSNVISG